MFGYCLIAYYTMMRPDCNLHLRWDEVSLDPQTLTGWYKLDQHKNVNKGIKAEGLLAQALEHETDHLDGTLYIDHIKSPEHFHKLEPEDEPEGETAKAAAG